MRLVGHAFAFRPFRAMGVALLGLSLSASALASERWLVLGGDIAEILSALGAEQHIVARDDTVVYPPEMAALPSVGYLRQLSAESVLSVSPTRILAAGQAGSREVLEQLAAVGVEVEVVSAPASLEAIAHKVRHVSEYIGEPQAGSVLAESLTADLERLAALPPLPDIQAMFILQHSGLTPWLPDARQLPIPLWKPWGCTMPLAAWRATTTCRQKLWCSTPRGRRHVRTRSGCTRR